MNDIIVISRTRYAKRGQCWNSERNGLYANGNSAGFKCGDREHYQPRNTDARFDQSQFRPYQYGCNSYADWIGIYHAFDGHHEWHDGAMYRGELRANHVPTFSFHRGTARKR